LNGKNLTSLEALPEGANGSYITVKFCISNYIF
jgi:hypothetical protein